MYYHMEIPLWFERMRFSFVYLDGCFYEWRAVCRRYRCVCVSRAEHNGCLIVPLDPFVLFCFVSFFLSLSFSLSIFRLIFHIYFFLFFDTLPREILFFFLKKKENHYWVARKFKQFGIQHYRNFMRFIIFTIELSIVNLILSKTK